MKPAPTALRRSILLISVLIAVAAASTVVEYGRASSGSALLSSALPAIGVLEADPRWLASDSAAGIRDAVVNVSWREWQPDQGVTDDRYRQQVIAAVDAYRSDGWTVTVDAGLQQPPRWVLGLPGGELVDQSGVVSSVADFEFSRPVRLAATSYLDALVVTLGGDATSFRVGLSEAGETLYPSTTSDQWWAFATAAQHGGTTLPPGVGSSPLPGWVPGQRVYRRHRLSTRQVEGWYDWYFGALVNAHAWEMATLRAAGFKGYLDLVMPGTGALPDLYASRLAFRLGADPADPTFTMNTGAVWWKLLDDLPDLQTVRVDVSSVFDPSGSPRGNSCRIGDDSVDYRTSSSVAGWSDTRWLSYLARRHGLPIIGENPGSTTPAAVPPTLELARSCGLTLLQWAWDYQLHGVGVTKGSVATIADLRGALTKVRSR